MRDAKPISASSLLAQPPQKGHRAIVTHAECAGGKHPPARADSSPKGWQRERVQRLARIFRCLDRGLAEGKPLRRMVVAHAWRWRGRHYKTDPSRPIRFGLSTIARLYRNWRKGGRIPAALALRHWSAGRKASTGQVVKLSKRCLAPRTRSFSAAYRHLSAPGATESAYRYATPARLRAALAALLVHRRREQVLERTAKRLLEEMPT